MPGKARAEVLSRRSGLHCCRRDVQRRFPCQPLSCLRDLNEQVKSNDGPNLIDRYLLLFSSPSIKLQLGIKRVIDLVGSALLLIALLPLMAIITLAVKCGSRGPVLFRQTRVGQRGRHFTFLKFRSMVVANDSSLHENYVKQFIHGTAAKNTNEKGEGVFKLTADPRVTRLGRFLRKTSMDAIAATLERFRGVRCPL